MNVGKNQVSLVKKAKTFIDILNKKKIDTSLSSFCYFCSWAEEPGYAKLKA